jgi:alpha-glucosidase
MLIRTDPARADRWWHRGVVYQIYPRSFQDSNGDGVGDLNGIRSRLDYLVWLAVDAIWISPIYPSPMADFGYDVSDYCGIHPEFGTLVEFDALVRDVHQRGLKIVLDFVPNHTSDRHPWFLEARSSRASPKRDFYLWRDARSDGGPPNNWLSEFGGSAWQWDAITGQYYYHAFLKEQPDLNWQNPAVREAMHDVLRFWLDRGVDGFRVDAIHHVIKDDQYRDNPPNPAFIPGMAPHRSLLRDFTTDRPEVQGVVAGLRRVVDAYDDRVLIGEAWLPLERLVAYYGEGLAGVHLPFNFHLIGAAWDARHIAALIDRYEGSLPSGAWPNWVLGNHDRSRIATRVGSAQAAVAAMLLLTLRGTPTMYYGDEIGMRDVFIDPSLVRDPWEKNVPGLGLGRDPERTPMQWNGGPQAGFTRGQPWLPLAPDHHWRNVESGRIDPDSMLSLYQQLLSLRRAEPALHVGDYRSLDVGPEVLGFVREHDRRRLVVLLNLTAQSVPISGATELGRVLVSTHRDRTGSSFAGSASLRADEGVVVETGHPSRAGG